MTLPHQMRAVRYRELGSSDVLGYEEVPVPLPGASEVLIEVAAVSVNHGPDVETRISGFGVGGHELPHTGGIDPVGRIVALGDEVTGWAVGDRVAVFPVIACGVCDFCREHAGENYCRNSVLYGVQTQGGRADYALAPASNVVPIPDGVSWLDAAALGVAYIVVWHGLIDRGKLQSTDTLLVVGAGGSVGVAAVQVGRLLGCRVIAVTGSLDKKQRLLELGASKVLSYRDPEWPRKVRELTGGRGATIAIDNSGTQTVPQTMTCLDRGGRVVISGGTTGFEVTLDVRPLYRNHIDMIFYVTGNSGDLLELLRLTDAGDLAPAIDRVFPMGEAARADDYLMTGLHTGRVILSNLPVDTPWHEAAIQTEGDRG